MRGRAEEKLCLAEAAGPQPALVQALQLLGSRGVPSGFLERFGSWKWKVPLEATPRNVHLRHLLKTRYQSGRPGIPEPCFKN